MVRQELTAPMVTLEAGQTPPGARLNRGTKGARPVPGLAARGFEQSESQIDDHHFRLGGSTELGLQACLSAVISTLSLFIEAKS